jgi:hypothetical protein
VLETYFFSATWYRPDNGTVDRADPGDAAECDVFFFADVLDAGDDLLAAVNAEGDHVFAFSVFHIMIFLSYGVSPQAQPVLPQ